MLSSKAQRTELAPTSGHSKRMRNAIGTTSDTGVECHANGQLTSRLRIWWATVRATWTESSEDNLSLVASGIAFNGFLALLPLLTAVVLGYGLVASPEQVARHIAVLAQAIPQDAARLIGQQLTNMVETADTTTGFGIVLSLAIAVFGAMRGATGIIVGLNIVYDVEESRAVVWRTLTRLAITICAILLFLVASLAVSLVNGLHDLLPNLGGILRQALQIGFWVATAVAVSLVIAAIYTYAPNRPGKQLRWLTPGSITATVVWVIATFAFSFYVRNFGNFNATYGALGAVIVFLLWLYLSAYILLLGAELNQVLRRRGKYGE